MLYCSFSQLLHVVHGAAFMSRSTGLRSEYAGSDRGQIAEIARAVKREISESHSNCDAFA